MAVLNVTAGDEASLRTVTAGAAAGDIIAVPAGTYNLTANWTVTKGVTIEPSRTTAGAAGPVTVAHSAARHGLIIDNSGGTIDRLTIRGIKLIGNGGLASGGTTLDGISFAGTVDKKLTNFRLEDVDLAGWRNGVSLVANETAGHEGASAGVYVTLAGCNVTESRTRGVVLRNCSMATVERCEINNSGQNGLWAQTCQNFRLLSSAVESNNTLLGTGAEGDAQVLIKLCHAFSVHGLDIEGMPQTGTATATGVCVSNCYSGSIHGLSVYATAFRANQYAVRFVNNARHVRVGPFVVNYITEPVSRDGTCPPFFPGQVFGWVQGQPSTLTVDGYRTEA